MTAPPLIPRSGLPAGWKWTKLRDAISDLQPGFACGERDTTGVVQVRMHNVSTAGSFNWGELIRVPSSYSDMSKYWVEPGDVLFNNTNSVELVGKSAIFSGFSEPIVFSNHFSRLRTDPGALEPAFLAKWLVLSWQQGLFASICNRWVGQAAVDRQKLLELTIPLPPLAEQKRIVGVLNEQLAAVERAKKAAEERLDAARALREALLKTVFESADAVTWPQVVVEDLCAMSARQVDPTVEQYRTMPHVNGENIESGTGRILYLKSSEELGMRSGKYLFRKGDVLYSKLRPYLRKATSVDFDGLCSADMYPLTPIPTRTTQEFLCLLLLSQGFTRYADDESKRSRMPKLNRHQLMRWRTRVPPIELQRTLVEQVNGELQRSQLIAQASTSTMGYMNLLPTRLLARAFSGEI